MPTAGGSAVVGGFYPEGTKMTTMSSGGRRKCHYTLPDESEVVEEYDLQTDELLVRKRRGNGTGDNGAARAGRENDAGNDGSRRGNRIEDWREYIKTDVDTYKKKLGNRKQLL